MNALKLHQLGKVVAIATIATAFSSLGLSKAEAITEKKEGFFIRSDEDLVTAIFSLNAHPRNPDTPYLITLKTALNSGSDVGLDLGPDGLGGNNEKHGTAGNGKVTGYWGLNKEGKWGLFWTIEATITPGYNPSRHPSVDVSFTTEVALSLDFRPKSSGNRAKVQQQTH